MPPREHGGALNSCSLRKFAGLVWKNFNLLQAVVYIIWLFVIVYMYVIQEDTFCILVNWCICAWLADNAVCCRWVADLLHLCDVAMLPDMLHTELC